MIKAFEFDAGVFVRKLPVDRTRIILASHYERLTNLLPDDTIKQATELELPFGGVGASGMGRYRGKPGVQAFSYERAVTKRYFFKKFFAVKPPYGNQLEKVEAIFEVILAYQ